MYLSWQNLGSNTMLRFRWYLKGVFLNISRTFFYFLKIENLFLNESVKSQNEDKDFWLKDVSLQRIAVTRQRIAQFHTFFLVFTVALSSKRRIKRTEQPLKAVSVSYFTACLIFCSVSPLLLRLNPFKFIHTILYLKGLIFWRVQT